MFNPSSQKRTVARLLQVMAACLAIAASACQSNTPSSPERGAERATGRVARPGGTELDSLIGREVPRPPPAGWNEAFGALVGPIRASKAGTLDSQPVESVGVTIWTRGATNALLMDSIKPRNQGAASEVLDILLIDVPPKHFLTDLCEMNGVKDPELLAEVLSDSGKGPYYTTAGAVFRLNRASRKIERVPADGIRCAVRSFGVGPD